jgi:hypothetical protein
MSVLAAAPGSSSAFAACPLTAFVTSAPVDDGAVISISTSPPLTMSGRADSVRTANPPPLAGCARAGVATRAIATVSIAVRLMRLHSTDPARAARTENEC